MSRLLKVCISTCALALISGAVSAQDGASKVRLGQIDLSFYAVTGAVVHEVLDRLGHDVEVVEGLHADIFPKLGKGEIDLLAAAWLPNGHGDYWRKYGDNATELAALYENAKLYWAVPAYVPEGKVESVQDLIKEGVKDRMKKEIRGIGEDSGLMKRSQTMLPEYGLRQAGYELVPGSASQWVQNFKQAVENDEWIIMPLWRPQWLNKAYELRVLADPKRIMGAPDRAVLVARKAFVEQVPNETLSVLKGINLGIDAVTEMDYLVNAKGMSPRQAARTWMEGHHGKVAEWFSQ